MSKKSRRKQLRQGTSRPLPYIPPVVERPFEGLANELELIAMRELLAAATLDLEAQVEGQKYTVTYATVLPNNVQALVRSDGKVMVGLQAIARTADPSHDLGLITANIVGKDPGTVLTQFDLRQKGPRLQDLVGASEGQIVLHEDLGFWLAEDEKTPEAAEAIARSADEIVACKALKSVRATYWVRMSADFLRMVMPDDIDSVFDGLARLRAAGQCTIGEGKAQAHFIGVFRAHGLAAPVWEFGERVDPADIEEVVADLRKRLDAAIASTEPLDADARRAREGIVSRQVAVR